MRVDADRVQEATRIMWRADQLDADRACVLVIDVQEKLLPLIGRGDAIVAAGVKLLEAGRVFELPVVATEQYPKGIGRTVEAIGGELSRGGGTVIEKSTFSAWAEPAVREAMLTLDRPQAILIGIEAHVCVQQTALDLVSRDYEVFVCADGVGSRFAEDYSISLERMRCEGVHVTTVESVLFELCQSCDTPRFKAMIEIIKQSGPGDGAAPAAR